MWPVFYLTVFFILNVSLCILSICFYSIFFCIQCGVCIDMILFRQKVSLANHGSNCFIFKQLNILRDSELSSAIMKVLLGNIFELSKDKYSLDTKVFISLEIN